MSDTREFHATLTRYLKARVPFISIRSTERARVLDILRDVAGALNAPFYVHTLSQGTRELSTGRIVNEDRSVVGAVDFASQQMAQRQNLSFVLTEVSDLEDDTPSARQLIDVAMLAADHGGSLVVGTSKPIFGQLQRLGMSLVLFPPTGDEMGAILPEQIPPRRQQVHAPSG